MNAILKASFLVMVTLCNLQAQNIDSLRFEVFENRERILILKDSVYKGIGQLKVDNLIANKAGQHFMTAGGAVIGSILFAGAASFFYAMGDKDKGWALYGVSAGFMGFAGIQIYLGGEKLNWLGKNYYISGKNL